MALPTRAGAGNLKNAAQNQAIRNCLVLYHEPCVSFRAHGDADASWLQRPLEPVPSAHGERASRPGHLASSESILRSLRSAPAGSVSEPPVTQTDDPSAD